MKLFSRKEKPKKKKSVLREYIESLVIALILALMVKTSVVEAYKIPSGSMEDTLLIGDFLLANKFIYGSRLPIPLLIFIFLPYENQKPEISLSLNIHRI